MAENYYHSMIILIKGRIATTIFSPDRPSSKEVAEADVVLGQNENSPIVVLKNRHD